MKGRTMRKRQPPTDNEELLDALADLFDEVEPSTPEEVDKVLREAGHDPDKVATKMKAMAERALAQSPLNWRNTARREMDEERARLDGFKPDLPESRTDLITAIRKLLASLQIDQGRLAAAHHRNFEEVTDEDLASLFVELSYLARHPHGHANDD